LDIDGSNSYTEISQTIALAASTKYKFSFWYKTGSAKTCGFRICNNAANVFLKSDGTWDAADAPVILPTSTSWVKYCIYFVTHASYTSYIVTLRNISSISDSLYFDDIAIEEVISLPGLRPVQTQTRPTIEQLTDGALEVWTDANNLTNWQKTSLGSSTLNRENTGVHGGTYCARFDIDGSNSRLYITNMPLILSAGKAYRFSFWYKTTSGKSCRAFVTYKSNGIAYYLQVDGTWKKATDPGFDWFCAAGLTNTSWTPFTAPIFTLPADCIAFSINLDTDSATSGSLYFDDVSLLELPAQVQDPLGWKFDGIDDRIFLPPKAPAFLSTFSVGCWVKYNTGAPVSEIFSNYGGDYKGFMFQYSGGYFSFATYSPSSSYSVNDTGGDAANQWYFIVGTYTGTTGKMYRNGILKNTNASMAHTKPEQYNPTLGSGNWAGVDFFPGQIALPFLVGRVMSDAEILNMFNATKHMFYPR
jgi:hypothetical protein